MNEVVRIGPTELQLDLNDATEVKRYLLSYMVNVVGVNPDRASHRDWLYALAFMLRGELNRRVILSTKAAADGKLKRAYFLSLEYLPGRSLFKNLIDLGVLEMVREVFDEIGLDLNAIAECEYDAALGNGGLGRLAACMLDSLATHRYPAYGYGLRYEFGMFRQRIERGQQVEQPEGWLRYGNPWEFERCDVVYPVKFYGRVVHETDAAGKDDVRWVDTQDMVAVAYDTPVAGYGSESVAKLRLWAARATRDFDFSDFNMGNYVDAVRHKTESENLSKVLYPNDRTAVGQELRLKQEYFFVSASLQDILLRCQENDPSFDSIPDLAAIQLNDTHPALAVAELMRLLVDEHGCKWKYAWDITRRTFSYTNHTLLPEALETWPIGMLEHVLPRHLEIIYRINHEFMDVVKTAFPGDLAAMRRLSLIDEDRRCIRMAHLAVVGSRKVNGVAELHTRLLRSSTFSDFDKLYEGKFVNVTNGITPRRWLLQANPGLASMVTREIGDGWPKELEQLVRLRPAAENDAFRKEFMQVKIANKQRLARMIADTMDIAVDPNSMFDAQIKRIHEYKRQLLNLLHVITRYNRILDGQTAGMTPRTVIISGKAAPGYDMAKRIIHLINDVARTVNGDPKAHDWLKLVFLPNYNVSAAEIIIPASDLSEQISTAGTEASGTGNMKLALNGALTIGTLDGANIEILKEVGDENMFVFGLTVEEAEDLRLCGYDPWHYYRRLPELSRALDMIATGAFSPEDPGRHKPVNDALLYGGDHYLLLADYAAYVEAQGKADALFARPDDWAKRAVINVASVGRFSSDRMVHDYAHKIWELKQLPT
jgi:starch phosphorylase